MKYNFNTIIKEFKNKECLKVYHTDNDYYTIEAPLNNYQFNININGVEICNTSHKKLNVFEISNTLYIDYNRTDSRQVVTIDFYKINSFKVNCITHDYKSY